jgi:hypothetical protein
VRRVLRRWRGPATDRLILGAARLVHPRASAERLSQSVGYMYLVVRHTEDAIAAALGRHVFTRLAAEPAPHSSPGQPVHRLAVLAAPPPPR